MCEKNGLHPVFLDGERRVVFLYVDTVRERPPFFSLFSLFCVVPYLPPSLYLVCFELDAVGIPQQVFVVKLSGEAHRALFEGSG